MYIHEYEYEYTLLFFIFQYEIQLGTKCSKEKSIIHVARKNISTPHIYGDGNKYITYYHIM